MVEVYNPYEKYGLRRVINAATCLTRLGGSIAHPEVFEAMKDASKSFIQIPELQAWAGRKIAKATGAEAGLPTAGANNASTLLSGPAVHYKGDRDELIRAMRKALYAAKICSYAQGFTLLKAASEEYDYDLKLGEIATIWRGGCIIRAKFLNRIREAYERNLDLPNLLLDPGFKADVESGQEALRFVIKAY